MAGESMDKAVGREPCPWSCAQHEESPDRCRGWAYSESAHFRAAARCLPDVRMFSGLPGAATHWRWPGSRALGRSPSCRTGCVAWLSGLRSLSARRSIRRLSVYRPDRCTDLA